MEAAQNATFITSSTTMENKQPSVSFAPSILKSSILSSKMPMSINGLNNVTEKCSDSSASVQEKVIEKPSLCEAIFKPIVTVAASGHDLNNDFVFGQNMQSRVVNAANSSSLNQLNTHEQESNSSTHIFPNTSSLFTSALSKVVSINPPPSDTVNKKQLKESAAELERKKNAVKIQLSDTPTVTGEEAEQITLKLSCNAYVFNGESGQWTGIGQSYLHLNDEIADDGEKGDSRLVIRLQSTRRVVVNTRIWAEMPLATVENKGIRIGALKPDGSGIRSYLLRMPSSQNADQLYSFLLARKQNATNIFRQDMKRRRVSNGDTTNTYTNLPVITISPSSLTTSSSEISTEIIFSSPDLTTDQKPSCVLSQNSVTDIPIQMNDSLTSVSTTSIKTSSYLAISLDCHVVTVNIPISDNEPYSATATIRITDYPASNYSVLEVIPHSSENEADSCQLTTTIGLRLAFCQIDDLTLQLFVNLSESSGKLFVEAVKNDGKKVPLPPSKVLFLKMASQTDADRLHRSLLLRVNRLFINQTNKHELDISSENIKKIQDEKKNEVL